MASRERILPQGIKFHLPEVSTSNVLRSIFGLLVVAGGFKFAESQISPPQVQASSKDINPPRTLPVGVESQPTISCSYGISETIQQEDGSIHLKGSGIPGETLDVRSWPGKGVIWVQRREEVDNPVVGVDGTWNGLVTPSDLPSSTIEVTDQSGCKTTVFPQKNEDSVQN